MQETTLNVMSLKCSLFQMFVSSHLAHFPIGGWDKSGENCSLFEVASQESSSSPRTRTPRELKFFYILA
jgi:hypothetical protein